MVCIENKKTSEQSIVTINLWINEPKKELYEVVQIVDLGTFYENPKYLHDKIKNLGLVEKSEALLNIKYNSKKFFFVPIPDVKEAYSKLEILQDLDFYCGVSLQQIKRFTPGIDSKSVAIAGLNAEDVWFVLKILNEKKFITLRDLCCITQLGRKYLSEHYFDRHLEPNTIPNKTQITPQIIKEKAGTVLVKIFKWLSKKIDVIIMGIIITVVGGCLLVCVINYLTGKGFKI